MSEAANFEFSHQMLAFPINACDVRLEITRRAICVSFLFGGLLAFSTRVACSLAPVVEQLETGSLGTIKDGQIEGVA